MDSLNDLLRAITNKLDQLTTTVDDLGQRTARLSQDSVWDVNILRQEMATKHNLHGLEQALAAKQDLARAVEVLCERIAASRFQSHQEHQELLRFMDEGPYGRSTRGATRDPRPDRRHERSMTLTMGEVLEIEDVGAVMECSHGAEIACTHVSAGRN